MGKRGLGPVTNGLLTNLVAYWSLDSYTGSSSPPSAGGVSILNNGGGSGFIGSGLISGGCDAPAWGNSTAGFYTSGTTALNLQNDYTISAWAAPYDPSGTSNSVGTVFRVANNASVPEAVALGLNVNTEEISYGISNTVDGTQVNQATFIWNGNSWNHFVLVYNSADSILSLYANGVALNSFYVSAMSSSSSVVEIDLLTDFLTTPLEWGSVNGKADELGLWQRQLTATQISALYNGGAGKAYSTFTV